MSWISKRVGRTEITMGLSEVIGKQRPRHTRSGAVYTPPKTRKAEDAISKEFERKAGRKWAGHRGEVRIRVAYWRCLSKSNPKYWAGRADLGKPDCDNVLKLVMDALKGSAYAEDAQVTYARVRKMPRLPFVAGNHIKITVDYYDETFLKEPKCR